MISRSSWNRSAVLSEAGSPMMPSEASLALSSRRRSAGRTTCISPRPSLSLFIRNTRQVCLPGAGAIACSTSSTGRWTDQTLCAFARQQSAAPTRSLLS
eukprot:14531395-Heterocapsa_arctica.AAC.1